MLGINGNINELRPTDGSGPDYFIQAHIFVEQGIDVERLTLGGVGPSEYYGDLVHYLMQTTQVLQMIKSIKTALCLPIVFATPITFISTVFFKPLTVLREWITRTAPYFLITPRQVDGRYGLWPVCPLNGANELSADPTVPALTITRDDIVAALQPFIYQR